ncbi:hypothetical protein CFOL_v3_08462 [Cephalotus follicularis]|uniref:Uncharacterized protein n=1 Tax=Cephalotus follicularis TaxID=3775 RepID=A0A1Q3BA86_CEPFO|nr:hypothetical protein CFOL_v3_08462 [Cephalotus follicularis]
MGGIRDIRQQDASEDDASDVSVEVETDETLVEFDRVEGSREVRELQVVDSIGNRSCREGGRGRWFIFAAAPIVSLVGIVLVLWLGNPPGGGSPCNLPEHQIRVPNPGSFPTTTSQRVSRNRRWWSLF